MSRSLAVSTLPTRPYRGTPAAERLSARRERLLEAALELLGTEGWQATTVRAVCQKAGLSPRYFYESFDDLEALLVELFDGLMADLGAATLAAVDAAPDEVHAKARAGIETLVRYVTDDPRRARVAFVEAYGSETLMRRRFDAMRMFSGLLVAEASDFYGFAPDDDPIAEITASMLVGGLAELLITWTEGGLEVTREQLIDDFTALFVATGETAVTIARRRTGKR